MLALFLFIICDVSSRRIGSQSKCAVGCNGRRMKSNTQHLQKNYVAQVDFIAPWLLLGSARAFLAAS